MSRADLERKAAEARDLAARARRLAWGLSLASNQESLNRFADDTNESAARMEAEAAALRSFPPKSITVEEAQQRQQGKHHSAELTHRR